MAPKDAFDNCRVSFAILGTLRGCFCQSSGAIGRDAGAGAGVGAGDVAGAGAGAGASRTPHSVRKLPIAYYTHNDQQQL